MKNIFTISAFILKFIICSGILNSAPASLRHILNPSESLTEISYEDEQDVEAIFGDVTKATKNDNILRRTYAEHERISELPEEGTIVPGKNDANSDHIPNDYNMENYVPFEIEPYSSIDTSAIVQKRMRKDKRKRGDDCKGTNNEENGSDISTNSPLEMSCNPQNVSDFMDDDSDPVKRFRIPKDQKKKIEDLLKEGKSVNQIIGIQDQNIRDGVWTRNMINILFEYNLNLRFYTCDMFQPRAPPLAQGRPYDLHNFLSKVIQLLTLCDP
ncbi:hypothetical protein ROZALSC1DRAFT_25428 [Rozella allomycis CSF55]|uniref:Uncharacterized protein n=1 Tax=Rozella allomycis (strain CSF55) TaxID=988480 RepID=A0A4P9YB82_ROZAC|nr:hypothetical protein ROZALSC1DRAFT_25428 [Rozella allomycis CSF55]